MANKIIMMELGEIIPYENNPRNNEKAVEFVANSIREFGFKNPIIVDKNNVIVAGHTRLKAAYLLGLEKAPVIVADDLTEEQVKAFRLADNKTAELADWDFDKLEEEIKELENIDMNLFGFEIEVEKYADEDDFDFDDFVEEIEEPTTKSGQLYLLGRHRLLVGDSTNIDDVKRLMDGKEADLLLTDPPYNVNVSNSEGMTIANDNMGDKEFKEFLDKTFKCANQVLKKGGAFYVWYGDCEDVNFRTACFNNGLSIRECLIWVKNGFNLGRHDYHYRHEPCLYGWKEGAAHYFIDDRTQDTVIEDKPNLNKMSKDELKDYIKELLQDRVATTILREDKPTKNDLHPTMKPIKLLSRQVKNSSRRGELVLDLFGGSGSTLITCEQLDRTCCMMEYEPKYADAIIERYIQLKGTDEDVFLIENGKKIPYSNVKDDE